MKFLKFKFVLTFFLSFIFVSYNFIFPAPSYAGFDTVSACQKQAACGAAFANELRVAASAPIVPSASKAVTAEVLNAAGQVVATTTATITPASSFWKIPSFIGLAGAAGLSVGLAKADMEGATEKMATNYCASNPSEAVCGSLTKYSSLAGSSTNRQITTYSITETSTEWKLTYDAPKCPNTNASDVIGAIIFIPKASSQVQYTDIVVHKGVCGSIVPYVSRKSASSPFHQWNLEKRSAAANLLSDSEINNYYETTEIINNSTELNYNEDSNFFNEYNYNDNSLTVKITNNSDDDEIQYITIDNSESLSISNSNTVSYTFDFSKGNTNNTTNNTYSSPSSFEDNNNITIGNNLPEFPTDEIEEYPDVIVPETSIPDIYEDSCKEAVDCIEPDFTKDNRFFWDVATEILLDSFPFDIVGDIPSGSLSDCPKIEAYDMELEVCEVNTVASFLKYPVWITFTIRLILST